jgi:tetratricopeptide (TPR) repeat protein
MMLSINLVGQENFKEIDAKSYNLYTAERWLELSQLSGKATQLELNYYYLNVRLGRAFFELKNYEKAKNYFEKALENNSASLFVKEYLFWCYINLNQEAKAVITYKSLPDSVQQKINYSPSRPIDYVYVESGLKLSANPDVAQNLLYGNVGLGHKISPFFDVFHSYTYMQQKAIWGEMNQHQYLIIPGVNLPKNWRVTTAINYSNYQSTLDYDDTFTWNIRDSYNSDSGKYQVDTNRVKNYLFDGSYKQNALFTQLNINKKIGNLSLTPHASYYNTWATPNYSKTIDTDDRISTLKDFSPPPVISTSNETEFSVVNTPESYRQWQFGTDINYTFGTNFMLGADINYIYHEDFSKVNISPYARLKMSNSVSIFAYYTRKGNYVLSLFEGSQLLNSFDEIKSKISLTGELQLSKKIGLFTTYQYESLTDNLSLRAYKFNSVFIGLKYRP